MRVYLCPVCDWGTAHPDSVGPLDHVAPVDELDDGLPACERVAELDHTSEVIAAAEDAGVLVDLGGGWYELPDGSKHHGKAAAMSALAELDLAAELLDPDSAGIAGDTVDDNNNTERETAGG